jgi:transcriptional regulator with XRE-family HTH domain
MTRLQTVRREAGLTQQQLAERARVSISTVQRAEQRRLDPTVETLRKFAAALECGVGDLIDEQRGAA